MGTYERLDETPEVNKIIEIGRDVKEGFKRLNESIIKGALGGQEVIGTFTTINLPGTMTSQVNCKGASHRVKVYFTGSYMIFFQEDLLGKGISIAKYRYSEIKDVIIEKGLMDSIVISFEERYFVVNFNSEDSSQFMAILDSKYKKGGERVKKGRRKVIPIAIVTLSLAIYLMTKEPFSIALMFTLLLVYSFVRVMQGTMKFRLN